MFKLRDVVSCQPLDGSIEAAMRGKTGRVIQILKAAVGPEDVLYEVELLDGTVPPGCAAGGSQKCWLAYEDEIKLVRRATVRRGYRVDAGPRTL